MRIGILGVLDNPYIADLQRAAQQYYPRVETVVIRSSDLQVGLGSLSAMAQVPMVNSVPNVDALIVRSMPMGTLEQVIFRMDCLQAWHTRGIEVINPPRSLEIAIDKWLCLQRLSEAGVVVPATICCQTRSAAMQAFEGLGKDVLVKPLFGGEGRGILRINDADMAWRVFGTLQQLGQVLYVQQFIEHFGYDIRVLFVGEQVYSISRVAAAGGWRTNVSLGGSPKPHCLSREQEDVAWRSRDVVGGSLLGVDLLPARDGRLFALEVNAVPGWKGLSAVLSVDIAKQVLDLTMSRLALRSESAMQSEGLV